MIETFSTTFQKPVGAYTQPMDFVPPETSLRVVAGILSQEGVAGVPISREGRYIGMVYETDIARALAEGAEENAAIERWVRDIHPVRLRSTGADALRTFEQSGHGVLAVVDDQNVTIGILTPSRLVDPPLQGMRPKPVGGMATPFGVYLTNGAVKGGAPWWALVATGAMMFAMFLVANLAVNLLTRVVPMDWILHPAARPVAEASVFVIFLLFLRLLPISGYHGAEHMVVHALEREEELVPETVRRMPRVHPRCGTNLAVAAMLFLGLFGLEWTQETELRLLVAFLAAVILWRPLGALMQQYVTTRRPSEKQLQSGIAAAKDLLNNFQSASEATPSVIRRLLNSGIFHIMSGAILLQLVAYGLMVLFNVPPEWRVSF